MVALSLFDDLFWIFVIPQASELWMPKMIGTSPLCEIDANNGFGF